MDENAAIGTLVGTLSATDPDAGDTHSFSLVAGAGDTDNGSFTIQGNQLLTNAEFDFETRSQYSIRVRVSDQDGLFFEQSLTITINDVTQEGYRLFLPLIYY